jgi:hypothetical protein
MNFSSGHGYLSKGAVNYTFRDQKAIFAYGMN